MATLTRKSPARARQPFANYSHVVTAQGATKLVFCAGQVAADPSGKVLPPDDFEAQTKMVMENLKLALAEGGANLKDVVKVTISTFAIRTTYRRRARYCRTISAAIHRPARFVCCADWQIQISCWRSKQSQLCERV